MKKTNLKATIFRLTLLSMFGAIIVAMTFIPYVGYITIPFGLSITTVHIIVILGAISLNSYSCGLILGSVWGVSCLLYAMVNGTADAAIFLDPRISVIPRMIVGVLVVAFYRLALLANKHKLTDILLKVLTIAAVSAFAGLLCQNISHITVASVIVGIVVAILFVSLFFFFEKNKEYMPSLFATLCGTFSNTALVLTAINIFGGGAMVDLFGAIKNIFSVAIALNGTVEILAAAIIAAPCGIAIQKALSKLR